MNRSQIMKLTKYDYYYEGNVISVCQTFSGFELLINDETKDKKTKYWTGVVTLEAYLKTGETVKVIAEMNHSNNKYTVFVDSLELKTQKYNYTKPVKNTEIIKEKIIERQVIMIRCPYCGKLREETQLQCNNCGGHKS